MKFTLNELAEKTGAKLYGDPEYLISSVADLESATTLDISFLANPLYTSLLKTSSAGAICIGENTPLEPGKNYLISNTPSKTFQLIAQLFLGGRKLTGFTGIHETALIHKEAKIGKNVTIGPYTVIDQGAQIGDETTIGSNSYIGPEVVVGKSCTFHSNTVVREYCAVGDRVVLQPGAVIGSCGFGYLTNQEGTHTKLEQLGNVILEDDVEIGANATIDRARFKTTRICKGTKIDNLVQIAHNVELGEHNLLAAQTGIAGSTKTGRNVMMGGQVGIIGHLEITDFSIITTRSGVGKSIKNKGKYGGSPVLPLQDHHRSQVHLRKLDSYVKRIESLEKRIAELESLPTCS